MDQFGIDDYKQTVANEITRLQTHLSDIVLLFKNKFYIASSMWLEVNDIDTTEHKRLEWCYDNDIPCKVIIIKPNDSFKNGWIK